MAEYQTKDNSGALFVNDKGSNDKRPDRTGRAMIGGKLYRVSGWMKKDKSGSPYLSLSFTEHDGAKRQGGTAAMADNDVPFAPEWRG